MSDKIMAGREPQDANPDGVLNAAAARPPAPRAEGHHNRDGCNPYDEAHIAGKAGAAPRAEGLDLEALRMERGWPTPISMRHAADALDKLAIPKYGDVLRWVADLCDGAAPRAEGLDVERLADLEHEQWAHWKESDREWARKVLARLSRPSDERVPEEDRAMSNQHNRRTPLPADRPATEPTYSTTGDPHRPWPEHNTPDPEPAPCCGHDPHGDEPCRGRVTDWGGAKFPCPCDGAVPALQATGEPPSPHFHEEQATNGSWVRVACREDHEGERHE